MKSHPSRPFSTTAIESHATQPTAVVATALCVENSIDSRTATTAANSAHPAPTKPSHGITPIARGAYAKPMTLSISR